ncbi:MAG TPA: hypothetical protein VFR34_07195 [Paracoccaceae bacterium]|nr:hypothetical protein [Paracoccaceae bacterium]
MRPALLLAMLLAACTGPYMSDLIRQPALPGYPVADMTYLMFEPAQGFRVEYLGQDGRAYLWAPGAGRVVPGVWRLEDRYQIKNVEPLRQAAMLVCLRFGARAGAVLGPGEWECRPRKRVADEAVAGLAGDQFGLARNPVPPFPLARCRPPGAFTLLREAGC